MLSKFVFLLALLPFINCDVNHWDPFIDIPLKDLKTSADRIREHGYPAETHYVETSDNYVLGLFRIPYSPKLNNQNVPKPAILLQHGLFSCSDCFLLNGPDNALAYNLVDAGFDVWLGNARGNIYSRNNTKMSTKHPYFWEFSWHEIALFDITAMIDHILEQTGQSSIHYAGHSQGCTVYFVLMSSLPEYNKKVKSAHMLAPSSFMGNTTDDLVIPLAPYVGIPGANGYNLMSSSEFLPGSPIVSRLLDSACGGDHSAYPETCKTLFLLRVGSDQRNLNTTLLPQIAETHPAGISSNQGIHYIQLYLSNKFQQFDFGYKKNMKKYNQPEPPEYELDKITSDVYLYYGLSDKSVNPKDVEYLYSLLPNVKLYYQVPDPYWSHIDFIFALQIKEEINDKIIAYASSYETDESL